MMLLTNINKLAMILLLILIFGSVTLAHADEIASTGPFFGNLSESWESFPNYGLYPYGRGGPYPYYLPSPESIMNGGATITASKMAIYEPSLGFPAYSAGQAAAVSDGVKGMMLDSRNLTGTIDFTTPVTEFGAYWIADNNNNNDSPGGVVSVSFYDSSDALVGATTFKYTAPESYGALEWDGWTFAVPVKSITYSGSFVGSDGLQAQEVPEPRSYGLLLCASMLWAALRFHYRRP